MTDKELIESLRVCADDAAPDCAGCHFAKLNAPFCIREMAKAAADRLQQLVPPCKVGDMAWAIRRYNTGWRPIYRPVQEMYFANDRLCIVVKGCSRGEFGKVAFWTKEEAEAAAKEANRG